MRSFLFILTFLCLNQTLNAQVYERRGNESGVLLTTLYYGVFASGGDLSDRFGRNFDLGIGAEYILPQSNIIFGAGGSILFGTEVKEDVLVNIRNSNGQIIGSGGLADVTLRSRGNQIRGYVGKLFGVIPKNKRSGIRVTVGAGFLRHKIRLQDNGSNAVQISGDNAKGYDRLSNGISIHQTVGYQVLSRNRLVNFHAVFEFTQGFTKNRRSVNWDTMSRDDSSRVDLLSGFSVGWSLPFYIGEDEETIFY